MPRAKLNCLFLSVLATCLFLVKHVTSTPENNSSLSEEAQNGHQLAINAFATLFFGLGDPQSENYYKDPFIDTSKSVFQLLENANDQITLDDLIRLFVQTILILIGNNRTDLFPDDFNRNIYLFFYNVFTCINRVN